jgi:hypothetical protein
MVKGLRIVGLVLVIGLFLSLSNWQSQGHTAGQESGEEAATSAAPSNQASETPDQAPAAVAATITVNSLADGAANAANCPGTNCRLRDAIAKAVAGDTINISVTGTITLNSGVLLINKNLTITGPGAAQLTVSGNNTTQVFSTTSTVSMSGLTVANGYRLGEGAGIQITNTGNVTLTNCTISNNRGVNTSGGFGGGIAVRGSSARLALTNCTISGNSAWAGGGIFNTLGNVALTNCTVSGNDCGSGGGGGIANTDSGVVTLTNCTVTGNLAAAGSGIAIGSGTVNARNTIIAGNTGSNLDYNGRLTSRGYNLIGKPGLVDGDLTGNILGVSPLLGPLGNYGGPTQTHALLPGSPAINAGNNCVTIAGGCLASPVITDQRGIGFNRIVGSAVDIGAFESRGFTLTIGGATNRSAYCNSAFSIPLAVRVTAVGAGEPVNGGQVTFTAPASGASATIAGNPATISGDTATTGTVTANSMIGPYIVVANTKGANAAVNFTLSNINTAPIFLPAPPISRQQGSPAGAAVIIGRVSDISTPAGSLIVTPSVGSTATGITVTDITNTNGTVTALVSASCTATWGTVNFRVSDGSLTSTGSLQVNVTPNTPPTIAYGSASVIQGKSTSVSLRTATDNGLITSFQLGSQGTYTGTISVDNSTGEVLFSNAAPVGTHLITIRALDNCNLPTTTVFMVTVINSMPVFTPAAPIGREKGSPAGAPVTIGTVSDPHDPASSLTVTQIAGGTATGITVTDIRNINGTVTALVSASCTATAGTVRFQVSDGKLTSTGNLQVNVTNTLLIITQPVSQSVSVCGSRVTFSVVATGENLTYQWRRNGVNIPLANTSSYTTPPVTKVDHGALYSVVVSGYCGTITSRDARLDVIARIEITTQPVAPSYMCVGSQPTFSVVATGGNLTLLTYQWRMNGVNVPGATQAVSTLPPLREEGQVWVDVVVTGPCATAISLPVFFNVYSSPQIITPPVAQTVCAGATATFSVTIGGSPICQWQKNGEDIPGATDSSYTTPPTTLADNGTLYSVRVGVCGVMSPYVPLTVNGYSLSSQSASFPVSGGSGSVNIIATAGCPWTAVSNNTWIQITAGASGSGNGTVNYRVASSTAARTGTMTIAGKTFTVNQGVMAASAPLAFTATAYTDGMLLEWQTDFEADNLGFRLYREEAGGRTLINQDLIAGSALRASATSGAGEAYAYLEPKSVENQQVAYWLEDIDLKGESTFHGPVYPVQGKGSRSGRARSLPLADVGTNAGQTLVLEPKAELVFNSSFSTSSTAQPSALLDLASSRAIKIGVRQAALYRLSQSQLLAAGLSPSINPRHLQLFVDGREVPILVSGADDGRFDTQDTIEFYGKGLDTPSSATRVYWLAVGEKQGLRINPVEESGVASMLQSFTQTVERRDRSVYFSALKNGDRENFFGAVITASGVDQVLTLRHLHHLSNEPATVEIALQGVTQLAHRVLAELNGSALGEILFNSQGQGVGKFVIQPALLREGDNTLRLTALGSSGDVSLVDSIRISYPHALAADDDVLSLSAPADQHLTLDGFSSKAIRIFDITEECEVRELKGEINESQNGYSISFSTSEKGERRLLALTEARFKQAASVTANQPSRLRATGNAADLLILTTRACFAALEPLKQARQAEGLNVQLVDVEDIYDEFSFGHKSPLAIKDFLAYARAIWQGKPRFVLLAGDASYDAKNYLGAGEYDVVPTKLINTEYMETASDDWLVDFDEDDLPDLAIGRLPARTLTEATVMVNKLLSYALVAAPDSALLVADQNDGFDFEKASAQLRAMRPSGLRVKELRREQLDPQTAKAKLLEALGSGQQVVNYVGQGSVNLWRGNLLTSGEALELRNQHLPLFMLMTSLNGYFQDATLDSLGEALLKAEHGGAVAVWALSGMIMPEAQAAVNQAFYRLLLPADGRGATLGEAARQAKAATADQNVRQTLVLLGDPSMRLR